ncbi:hypothetical protein D9C73_019016 [Collichthys lucidus]|uniref:Uncharacterized protein n=1 Tax=Collichthys lucidus TaxID=240159 RepID=A0A4U5V8R8_COLLU|nr:hypothetical protein D9C73_019016 [Collichthys lucidus]
MFAVGGDQNRAKRALAVCIPRRSRPPLSDGSNIAGPSPPSSSMGRSRPRLLRDAANSRRSSPTCSRSTGQSPASYSPSHNNTFPSTDNKTELFQLLLDHQHNVRGAP